MLLRTLVLALFLLAFAFAYREQICRDGECYPRIFVPTEEFQIVREGQEIPVGISIYGLYRLPLGLHVKINMQVRA
jgi:hypothetical protein